MYDDSYYGQAGGDVFMAKYAICCMLGAGIVIDVSRSSPGRPRTCDRHCACGSRQIGANVGQNLRLFARNRNVSAVYAFEPWPAHYHTMHATFNGSKKIKLFNAAVAEADGTKAFFPNRNSTSPDMPGNQLGSLVDLSRYHGTHGTPLTVRSVRLDTVLATLEGRKHKHVHLMKIDVETNEPAVLQGASATLARTSSVQFECNGIYAGEKQLKAVTEDLRVSGFEVYKLGPREMLRIDGPNWQDRYDRFSWENCLAIRPHLGRLLRSRYASKPPSLRRV